MPSKVQSFFSSYGYINLSNINVSKVEKTKYQMDVSLSKILVFLASYIPLIGSVLGAFKIIQAKDNLDNSQFQTRKLDYAAYGLMTRGVIELLSCGILLLIPDLIMTIGRTIVYFSQ